MCFPQDVLLKINKFKQSKQQFLCFIIFNKYRKKYDHLIGHSIVAF